MNIYHVTYYYLATGMEGIPDIKDHGLVRANSKQEAINIVGYKLNPREPEKAYRNWGLSAELIRADTSKIFELK